MSNHDRRPSPAQLRASRAALDWSLTQAAQQARLSVSFVLKCERGQGSDLSTTALRALRECYEVAGVRFLRGEGEGIEVVRPALVRFAL